MLAAQTLPPAPANSPPRRVRPPGGACFGTLERMRSSVSIVLFFLLSGFFLSTLLGALEHSRKLLGVATACFVAVACVIALLTPIQLPSWRPGSRPGNTGSTVGSDGELYGHHHGHHDARLAGGRARRLLITTEALVVRPPLTTN